MIQCDFTHPFLRQRDAVNDGILIHSLERVFICQFQSVSHIGIIQWLCVRSVRCLFLNIADIIILTSNDRLIVVVNIGKIIALRIKQAVFYTDFSLDRGEMCCICVDRIVVTACGNNGQSPQRNIFTAIAYDAHSGLTVQGHVRKGDVFCIFYQHGGTGMIGVYGVPQKAFFYRTADKHFYVEAVQNFAFSGANGMEMLILLYIVKMFAQAQRGTFFYRTVLVHGNNNFGNPVLKRSDLSNRTSAERLSFMINGDSAKLYIFAIGQRNRFHKPVY